MLRVLWFVTTLGVALLVAFTSLACSAPPTAEPTKAPQPTVMPQPTALPQPTLTIAPTVVPATSSATPIPATPTVAPSPTPRLPATATALPTVTAPRIATATATSTSIALLAAPQLTQPSARASFGWNAPVILAWTWERALQAEEYFQVQLSREDAEPRDLACIPATTYVIAQPPQGYGWYQWRVVARRGRLQGDQCAPQFDLSRPSEIRTFEWRMPPEPPPTVRPYP